MNCVTFHKNCVNLIHVKENIFVISTWFINFPDVYRGIVLAIKQDFVDKHVKVPGDFVPADNL